MTAVHSDATELALHVKHRDGVTSSTVVAVRAAYNFGFAARDNAGVRAHVEEMRAIGISAPARVPAIFSIPPERISTVTRHIVSGEQTYGEVEFAMIKAPDIGWLVTVAADHTDLELERANMAKAKASGPDVIGSAAWPLAEVNERWDDFTLSLWGIADDGQQTLLQSGATKELLRPEDLIRTLEARSGTAAGEGTVIMSGTIAGEPTPGFCGWHAELGDTATQRALTLSYTVTALPEEI
jgi:Protein of unknown function (DUF2848)